MVFENMTEDVVLTQTDMPIVCNVPIPYMDWDPISKKMTNALCSVYEVYSKQTKLEADKWYVVRDDVQVDGIIQVWGTKDGPSRLILCDGKKLSVFGGSEFYAAICLDSDAALAIYGQQRGTGELSATCYGDASGIGTSCLDITYVCGMLTINGGVVTATGGAKSAGIGGFNIGSGGIVTINGGTLTATGGSAGIGPGSGGAQEGSLTFADGAHFAIWAGVEAPGLRMDEKDFIEEFYLHKYVHIERLLEHEVEPGAGEISEGGLSKFDASYMYDGEVHTIKTNELVAAFSAAVGGEVTVNFVTGEVGVQPTTGWTPLAPAFTEVGEHVVWYKVSSPGYEDYVRAAKVTIREQPRITSVSAKQRYPWNGLVDIVVTFEGESNDVAKADCLFVATNNSTQVECPVVAITCSEGVSGSDNIWKRRFVWDAAADVGEAKIEDIVLTAEAEILPSGCIRLWRGGPCWAECNVGATLPEEFGYYFWWGDTVGYRRNASNDGWVSVKDSSSFTFDYELCPTGDMIDSQLQSAGYVDATGNLVPAHDAATAHWGAPWRMPTYADIRDLVNSCDSEWTMRNGVWGRLVKGRGTYASKSIFLPATGCGRGGAFWSDGGSGWSSTLVSSDSSWSYIGPFSDDVRRYHAWSIHISSHSDWTAFEPYDLNDRGDGQSVRPVRDFQTASGCAVTTHLALDCRTGDRVSAGTEELTFSNLWDGDKEATVTIAQDGAAIFTGLSGEGVKTWSVDRNGRYELTHTTYTNGVKGKVETAVFVVEGKEVPVGDLTIDWGQKSFVYDGQPKEPIITVKDRGTTLTRGTHYLVEYKDNINVGTAKAIVKGVEPYVEEVTNTFAITKAPIGPGGGEEPGSGEIPEGGLSKFDRTGVYNGKGQTIDLEKLEEAFAGVVGDDFTISFAVGENGGFIETALPPTEGWGEVAPTITDIGELVMWYKVTSSNYEDYVHQAKVTVVEKVITDEMVRPGEDAFFFDGDAKKPTVDVVYEVDGKDICTESDYTLTYGTKAEAGWWVTVTGKGNYSGTVTKIVPVLKRPVAPPVVTSKSYTGKLQKPTIPTDSRWTVVANPGGINVGEYPNVVLRLTNTTDYKWKGGAEDQTDITLVFKVTKGNNGWSRQPGMKGWAYGETPSEPAMGQARYGTVKVAYRKAGADVSTETATRPELPGKYLARFWVDETENFIGVAVHEPYKDIAFEITGSAPGGTETTTTPVPVPHDWLDAYVAEFGGGDYETAANAKGRNGVSLWESYVAGLDPTNATSQFKASITMGSDGKPVITWEPDMTKADPPRTYTTYGKVNLLDKDWTPVTDANRATMHFFKVGVELEK